ncbi:hypothetical protein T02_2379 [Trichinella nativa]|uniref:Uncharacterized protein n=1 Tax=Trichinella nativa TaxID=6335 RepID=A0A0V1LPT7_9BILA|nr:hypothetical protein T02_2379 [Trichinella nativa]
MQIVLTTIKRIQAKNRINMKNEKLNNDEQQTRCGQKRCSNCLAFTERLQASRLCFVLIVV